jgi:hypothetical protein
MWQVILQGCVPRNRAQVITSLPEDRAWFLLPSNDVPAASPLSLILSPPLTTSPKCESVSDTSAIALFR